MTSKSYHETFVTQSCGIELFRKMFSQHKLMKPTSTDTRQLPDSDKAWHARRQTDSKHSRVIVFGAFNNRAQPA